MKLYICWYLLVLARNCDAISLERTFISNITTVSPLIIIRHIYIYPGSIYPLTATFVCIEIKSTVVTLSPAFFMSYII